jgi:CHASE2 domain-containing sensor protein
LLTDQVQGTHSNGIALLQLDDDGAVRRYWPTFTAGTRRADGGCDCGATLDSLPRAAIKAAGLTHGPTADAKPLLLDWRGDRFAIPRIPATQVLDGYDEDWWGSAQPIRGRVVVIGGTFREARDTRWTPAGEMTGMEIIAHIIEAEASGGGLANMSLWMAIVLEIVAGLALMWLNWWFPAETRLSLVVNGLVVFALPLVASFVLHRYALYWINIAPVLAGVWIHQWHTRAHMLAHRPH